MIYKRTYLYKDDFILWEILVKIHLVFNRIYLQEKFVHVLIYFLRYGINKECYNLLIKDKVVPSRQTISNAKTQLKQLGLIEKVGLNWNLLEPISGFSLDNFFNIIVQCRKIQ